MIRLENVTKTFQSGMDRVTAIEGFSLHIPGGEITLLTGPNASGKTTLLSLMAGLISPSRGRVFFDGMDISRLPERWLSRMRRERVGIIFQERHLMRDATVMENLTVPLIPMDMSHREIKRAASKILSRFGLEGKGGFKVGAISGGQKQRLVIARALINDPDVILADEPTTHLDEELLRLFKTDVTNWKEGGKTVVIATHDVDLMRGIDTDLVIELQRGRIQEALRETGP